jgi:5-oxopent-3-ene-1,2,5-tricarboxylate decarboxylase / 2-hydroxyhepta-2,4-diene-1,7-dioate isomerase
MRSPVALPARRAASSVVAPLLNWPQDLAALGDTVHAPPYKAPPRAPVLYLKPRNTWCEDGDAIVVPAGVPALRVGATLGAVIGRSACRVRTDDALDFVAGWVVVNDLAIPHASYHRPALRERCRDGFCPISAPVRRDALAAPDAAHWWVSIDGQLVEEGRTAGLARPFARLLADVTEFMTLHAGDTLLLGSSELGPLVRAGQTARVTFDGVGSLANSFVADDATR